MNFYKDVFEYVRICVNVCVCECVRICMSKVICPAVFTVVLGHINKQLIWYFSIKMSAACYILWSHSSFVKVLISDCKFD